MEYSDAKKIYRLKKAFDKCFCDERGGLSKDGEIVIAFLRDFCCAKGERGKNGSPYQIGRAHV